MKNRIWSLICIFNLLCLVACQSDPETVVTPKVVEKPAPVAAVNTIDQKTQPEEPSKILDEESLAQKEAEAAEKIAEEKELEKEAKRATARRKKRAEKREAEALRQKELEAENQRLADQSTENSITEAETNIRAGKLQFSDRSHDFGRIQEGDTLRHEFSFFNTGIAPIVITNVKASCGCTKTKYPEEPIMPGEKGAIGVTFDSKGKLGRQKPFISVTTNGFPKIYSLYLEGEVDTERL